MKRFLALVAVLAAGAFAAFGQGALEPPGGVVPPPPPPSTDTALTTTFNGKALRVAASRRFGAAIYSITINGLPFIDSTDHGRELQTAWQYDGQGEGQNPTEAGSAADSAGATSSTAILSLSATATAISSRVNPAFWYAYGGKVASSDFLEKTVTLGLNGKPNILVHDIGMYLASPYHSSMAVEGLTAYMPTVFSRLFTFDHLTKAYTELPASSSLTPTPLSVIAATADLSRAVALVQQNPAHTHWIGKIGPWPKLDASWFSVTGPAGWYRWRTYTVVGSFQEVLDAATVIP